MFNTRRFAASALPFVVLGALMVPGAACDKVKDAASPGALCCTDFQVGADLQNVDFGVDASVQGQFKVFAQAAADVGAIASASLSDVELACKGIAVDFGATDEQQKTAAANTDAAARVKAWCTLAVASFNGAFAANGKFAAAGELTMEFVPPQCAASVSASANCSAQCSASGSCDVKANPPTCEGGKMEISCSGSCSAEAGATIECQGSCDGNCEGSCTATGGVSVACDGTCDGTCEADAQGGGSGIQADGTCKGKCNGTCTASATAPAAKCEGSCNGSCSGSCKAAANATVKCDGKCDGDFEPISCKGGELKASCEVDANCDANCSASASAKATCTPPSVTIKASGAANLDASVAADFQAAIKSLEANLALILQVRTKAEAAVKIVTQIAGGIEGSGAAFIDPGKLGVKGTACLIPIVGAFVTAGEQLTTSVEASGTIVTGFNMGN